MARRKPKLTGRVRGSLVAPKPCDRCGELTFNLARRGLRLCPVCDGTTTRRPAVPTDDDSPF